MCGNRRFNRLFCIRNRRGCKEGLQPGLEPEIGNSAVRLGEPPHAGIQDPQQVTRPVRHGHVDRHRLVAGVTLARRQQGITEDLLWSLRIRSRSHQQSRRFLEIHHPDRQGKGCRIYHHR